MIIGNSFLSPAYSGKRAANETNKKNNLDFKSNVSANYRTYNFPAYTQFIKFGSSQTPKRMDFSGEDLFDEIDNIYVIYSKMPSEQKYYIEKIKAAISNPTKNINEILSNVKDDEKPEYTALTRQQRNKLFKMRRNKKEFLSTVLNYQLKDIPKELRPTLKTTGEGYNGHYDIISNTININKNFNSCDCAILFSILSHEITHFKQYYDLMNYMDETQTRKFFNTYTSQLRNVDDNLREEIADVMVYRGSVIKEAEKNAPAPADESRFKNFIDEIATYDFNNMYNRKNLNQLSEKEALYNQYKSFVDYLNL